MEHMASKLIALRVDERLIERLDAEAWQDRAREYEPLRRSTFIRRLIREALDARASRKVQP